MTGAGCCFSQDSLDLLLSSTISPRQSDSHIAAATSRQEDTNICILLPCPKALLQGSFSDLRARGTLTNSLTPIISTCIVSSIIFMSSLLLPIGCERARCSCCDNCVAVPGQSDKSSGRNAFWDSTALGGVIERLAVETAH